MKKCSQCKVEKSVEQYYKQSKKKDGLASQCKECSKKYDKSYNPEVRKAYRQDNAEKIAAQMKERRIKTLNFLNEIKLTAGCMDCGYNSHPEAIDFDHRPKEIKEFSVSRGVVDKFRLIQEIMKCDVVCANCHRIRTAARARLKTID